MLNILLNIIGIVIIFYALILIKKDREGIKDLEEDSFIVENILEEDNNFSAILDEKTKMVDGKNFREEDKITSGVFYEPSKPVNDKKKLKLNEKTIEEVGYGGIIKDAKTKKMKTTSNNERIIEMKNLGYSKEEIAKKTGRSIREIEVIFKMYV